MHEGSALSVVEFQTDPTIATGGINLDELDVGIVEVLLGGIRRHWGKP